MAHCFAKKYLNQSSGKKRETGCGCPVDTSRSRSNDRTGRREIEPVRAPWARIMQKGILLDTFCDIKARDGDRTRDPLLGRRCSTAEPLAHISNASNTLLYILRIVNIFFKLFQIFKSFQKTSFCLLCELFDFFK